MAWLIRKLENGTFTIPFTCLLAFIICFRQNCSDTSHVHSLPSQDDGLQDPVKKKNPENNIWEATGTRENTNLSNFLAVSGNFVGGCIYAEMKVYLKCGLGYLSLGWVISHYKIIRIVRASFVELSLRNIL